MSDSKLIERLTRERDEARERAVNWEASCREAYADLGGERACTMAVEADRDHLAAQVAELRREKVNLTERLRIASEQLDALGRIAASDLHRAEKAERECEELRAALSEARDALNGAPNTVSLHAQIDHAILSSTQEQR